uniref:zinc finger protein RFP-like n=1 Tax=Euleptes europaea TaxID=460621 RepID=UPI00253FE0B1|nr:zinc finger protein RFP-like [Euleptes europaea]
MADENPVQGLCEETTCSICLEYFKDPVIIDCGHIFCQACITRCWGESEENISCPQCRETFQQRNFKPVRQLASIVAIAKKFSLQIAKGAEALGQVCERHQEPLKLFCKDDETPICVVCDKSKEHCQHKVIPKEEAFEEYKGQIQTNLEFLKNKKREMLSSQQSGETESQTLLEQTERERQKIVAGFKQLRQFLEEQECRLLAELKDLDDLIKGKRNAHVDKLFEEISSVDILIKEMEAKQKQPTSEFLQDIKNFLQRCQKKKFVKLVAFPPGLKEQIRKFSEINPFLDTVMKEFKVTVLSKAKKDAVLAGPQAKKANVTGSGTCTIPTLVLWSSSGFGQQSSSYRNSSHDPNNLSCWSYVMGFERINSGNYSWVINIKDEKFWAVGVALEDFRGDIVSCLAPEEGIWAVGKSTDNCLYAFNSSGSQNIVCPWSNNWRRARRIGPCNTTTIHVDLNYEQDSVTFSNAADNSVIYIFYNASFFGEQISSFFSVGK